jgi:hypothetical protein
VRWQKLGRVYAPDGQPAWMGSHASLPVPFLVPDGRLRVAFGARDATGRSRPGWVELDPRDPLRVERVGDEPLLELGRLGSFDDNGITPSSLVDVDGDRYLYYIGWNPQVTVSYRLSIGLAISRDGGLTFARASEGPVMDRAYDEPFFNTAPCVLREGRSFKMWFVSCTGWSVIDGRTEPQYTVRHAWSDDGRRWTRAEGVCFEYDAGFEAYGRPWVFAEDGVYRMIFSYRSLRGYRTETARGYRLGLAESRDGLRWERRDGVGIETSESGWDSEMIEYASVLGGAEDALLFYNGNGFGLSGFGVARRAG